MAQRSSFILFVVGLLFLQVVLAQNSWQEDLKKRHRAENYETTVIDQNIIKLKHKESGMEKYLDISDHPFDRKKIPETMQFFDLINADTNLFNYKYKFKNRILLSGSLGYPLLFGDVDNDTWLDIVGMYKVYGITTPADCGIAELQIDSVFSIQKIYKDTVVTPLSITDCDSDGLKEINFKIEGGQEFYNYEALTDTSYPDILNYHYRMWYVSGAVGSETFLDMDGDQILDVLYVGADTLPPHGQKVYIGEFDQTENNFVQKFRYPPPDWRVSGFSVGDFDQDGFQEFATGSIAGDVYIFENTGNDTYELIFSDTISAPNAYVTCATNDIDHNDKPEFFIGGSSYYNGIAGTKFYWYEANGNNRYQKIRTFFLWGTDVLGTTELYAYDVNADGIDDLCFAFGGSVVILTWNPDGFFDLYYLDWLENWDIEIQSVNIFDVYHNKQPALFVSYWSIHPPPAVYSNYYENRLITGIVHSEDRQPETSHLNQNYPNPFNSSTILSFYITRKMKIDLTIFDINGKEVNKLIQNHSFQPGMHEFTWNGRNSTGKEVSSGIYMYQLKSDHFVETKKLLLLR
jgi:hypothetical protein